MSPKNNSLELSGLELILFGLYSLISEPFKLLKVPYLLNEFVPYFTAAIRTVFSLWEFSDMEASLGVLVGVG